MWAILDKAYKPVGVLNDNTPNSCPLLSAVHREELEDGYSELEFSVPSLHEDADLLEIEGFIVYADDKDGTQELFRIVDIEEEHGENVVKKVSCETASTTDLRTTVIRKKTFTGQALSVIMEYLVANSTWELGDTFYDDIITIEFNNTTALDAIREVVEKFDAEIEFKVIFDGNDVIKKIINVYDQRGDQSYKVFDYRLDLKGVKRHETSLQDFFTALVVEGKEGANGEKLTLQDAAWSPPSPFEIVGDYICDIDALQQWCPDGKHREGVYNDSEAENAVELAQNALAQLKKVNTPPVTYEASVVALERLAGYEHTKVSIGDTVRINDLTFNPPLYLEARVFEKEIDILEPEQSTVTLGDYKLLKVKDIVSIQKLQKKIEYKEKVWDVSYETAQKALETVNDVKEQIVYKVELQTTNGTVFRNGVINTQLTAVAFKGKEDITSTLPNTSIVWTKYDVNGSIDTAWNQNHINTGKVLSITQNDIYKKATIKCEILIDSRSVASITTTLIDINDGVISGLAPQNPTEDFLWIDISVTPNMLKKWSNNSWVNLGQLDPQMSQTISAIRQTLDDMASDSIIDYKERQMVKDDLTKVIGFVIPDDQLYLPATTTLDSSLKGEFYTIRKGATLAGISTSDAKYVDVATKYNDLKTYLDGFTPLRAWNVSTGSKDINVYVDKPTWRDKWLQYRLAVAALDEATIAQTKANVDNVQIGWRNVIRNSTFNKTNIDGNLVSWTNVNGLWSLVDTPESDKPNSNILRATASGNTTNPLYSLYSNYFNVKKGDIWTVTLDLKVGSFSGWDTKIPFILEFYDSTGTKVESKNVSNTDLKLTTMTDNTWYRPVFTYTVTTTGVMTGRIRPLLYKNGDLYIREVQVERGTKPTDYKEAVEDSQEQIAIVEARVSDIEQSTSPEAIVTTLTQSTQYAMDLSSKADADSLGNYATSDELNDAVNAVDSNTDQKIANIDFTPFAQKSDLSQTVTDITAKFQASGGINIVKNSVGYSGTSFWNLTDTMSTVQNDELSQLGFGSGWFSPLGTTGYVEQSVFTTVGQVYTLSVFVKKTADNTSSAWAGIDLYDQLNNKITFVGFGNSQPSNGFKKLTYTFTATTPIHKLRVTCGTNAEAIISGVMLNIGEIPLQWSMAAGEIYNTNIKMDANGIQVVHYDNGVIQSKTVMTPDNFAGFYDNNGDGVIDETPNSVDEVFKMSRDEFIMKKTVAKEEITMGTVKIVKIASSSKNGWAFVSNLEG